MSLANDPSDAPASAPPTSEGLPPLTPDVVEQEQSDEIDNVVPTGGYAKLPVVGLGGSAGGLAALQAFFGAMPPVSGMAFVVIMHLSPEHESILAELLGRATSMPVHQVRERTKVEANHVYVIPPAKYLSMSDGHLRLSDFARARRAKHVAVDLFFRTLADSHGPHAAAVVLSGADGDGAVGIKRVKERGGLTVAQDPDEAEQIVGAFVRRWAMEVTFQAARAHLGIEGQRQWSDLAITRSTPLRLALFSLVALLVHRQPGWQTSVRQAAWYKNALPTFSDALAQVRRCLWQQLAFCTSQEHADERKPPAELLAHLGELLAYAA